MKLGWPWLHMSRVRLKLTIGALIIVILGVGAYFAWTYTHNKPITIPNSSQVPSKSQQISSEHSYAQDKLNAKDYQSAVNSYLGAATDAFSSQDYPKAVSLLQECINKVPDDQVPYYIYSALYMAAKGVNNTSLEKSSLQTAIQKAESANSGADQATIRTLQNDLAAIK